MSATDFEWKGIEYLSSEYVITELKNNGMVVYRNRHATYFFYFVVSILAPGDKYWALGRQVGSETISLFNPYCANLENPANGNCKYGWFYYSAKSREWKYDMNLRIQCTNYVQNSIT